MKGYPINQSKTRSYLLREGRVPVDNRVLSVNYPDGGIGRRGCLKSSSSGEGSSPSRGTKFIMRHSQVQGTHHSLYGYQFP